MKYFILTAFILFYVSTSNAASFDCKKASTFVEKAICSENELSTLDDLLGNFYKKSLDTTSDKKKLISEQRAWLLEIRNECQDSDCLKKAYNERISFFISSDNSKISWEGDWNRITPSIHEGAKMEIIEKNYRKFDFLIDAFSGGYSGQIEGAALFAGDYAVYNDDTDSHCKVDFRMNDNCIEVKTENCSGRTGVYFDGTYCSGTQDTEGTSKTYFIKIGVFIDNNELQEFKKVVGTSYSLFENCFQLVYEEEDKDNINAKVFSGGVRGLFGIMEGIIMYNSNGNIYAAVIDNDTIKYFSNDPIYKNKLPTTIDKWKERFKNKRLIFNNSEQ